MIPEDDREAIIAAAHTFRPGAPIMVDDIRLACEADGHSVRHLDSWQISEVMRSFCRCQKMPCHRRASYYLEGSE